MSVPRTKEARDEWLRLQRREAYEEGYNAGAAYVRELNRKSEQAARQDALKAVTAYMSAAGQTVQAFAEAMKSERNQL